MQTFPTLIDRIIALLRRYHGVAALFGFVSGVASFVLANRQEGFAKVVAGLMLVSWVWLAMEHRWRDRLTRRLGGDVLPALLRFVTQMVHQESLFFVLPFLFFTSVWNSPQFVFLGLIALAALVSIVDPVYNRLLVPRRWLYLSYHTFTLFAVLLAALPILLHLTTRESYQLALVVSAVLAVPSFSPLLPPQKRWRLPLLVTAILLLCLVGWQLRRWVPPATLWLTEVALSEQLDENLRAPGAGIKRIGETALHSNGLYAYTAIRAPLGLRERIYHVWRKDGKTVDRIALRIEGGRREGYRAWSHKDNFPADALGKWQVLVMTEGDQRIGQLDFEVVDN